MNPTSVSARRSERRSRRCRICSTAPLPRGRWARTGRWLRSHHPVVAGTSAAVDRRGRHGRRAVDGRAGSGRASGSCSSSRDGTSDPASDVGVGGRAVAPPREGRPARAHVGALTKPDASCARHDAAASRLEPSAPTDVAVAIRPSRHRGRPRAAAPVGPSRRCLGARHRSAPARRRARARTSAVSMAATASSASDGSVAARTRAAMRAAATSSGATQCSITRSARGRRRRAPRRRVATPPSATSRRGRRCVRAPASRRARSQQRGVRRRRA